VVSITPLPDALPEALSHPAAASPAAESMKCSRAVLRFMATPKPSLYISPRACNAETHDALLSNARLVMSSVPHVFNQDSSCAAHEAPIATWG